MTKDEFIQREISVWGTDYIFDLIDKGYEAVEMVVPDGSGTIRWWWRLPALTQPGICATLPESRSGVSPVSSAR